MPVAIGIRIGMAISWQSYRILAGACSDWPLVPIHAPSGKLTDYPW